MAIIGEFVQNSYDAGAANIDFRLVANAAARVGLQVDGDGCGMDQVRTIDLDRVGGCGALAGEVQLPARLNPAWAYFGNWRWIAYS